MTENEGQQKSAALQIFLPYPSSVNGIWRSGNGRTYKAKEYRAWEEAADEAISEQKPGCLEREFFVTILVGRPDKRRRDLDNLVKPLLDACERNGVVEDDCHNQGFSCFWDAETEGVMMIFSGQLLDDAARLARLEERLTKKKGKKRVQRKRSNHKKSR